MTKKTVRQILAFLLLSKMMSSQTHIFLSPDSITNCGLIKAGKFISTEYSIKDYYMTVKNGIITEYVQNGKYYLKSKVEFTSPCTYKSNIIEVTIPNYTVKKGEFAITEILQTECDFIKIKTKMGDKEILTVLEKIK